MTTFTVCAFASNSTRSRYNPLGQLLTSICCSELRAVSCLDQIVWPSKLISLRVDVEGSNVFNRMYEEAGFGNTCTASTGSTGSVAVITKGAEMALHPFV